MKVQAPTVGRIVHYSDHQGKCWPAMVIAVVATPEDESTASLSIRCLKVWKMFGDEIDLDVPYSEDANKRTWRWPPHVTA